MHRINRSVAKCFSVAVLSLFLAFSAMAAPKDVLKCYYRIGDITPTDHVVLAGFAARKGLSTTIHRQLKSHCLVISKRSEKVCIITNDLMEISPEFSEEIRKMISEKSHIPYDHIFMTCIHTHSAPRTGGWCSEPGESNYNYHFQCQKGIVDNAVAAITASETLYKPFSMEVARGHCEMNTNRCEKDGPIDRDVYALRLLDSKKQPIVALLNYSCHPVSLNWRSMVVSNDYTGYTCEALSAQWKCPVFFFTGASGNIDPAGGLKSDTLYTKSKGVMLSDAIINQPFKRIKSDKTLCIANQELHLPYQVDTVTEEALNKHVETLMAMSGVSESWKDDVARWQKRTLKKIQDHQVLNYLPFHIGAVNVGGVILLFTQGEPFCEYQMNLRKQFPDRYVFFDAYCNGQNSYLPSAYAFSSTNKGYDYEKKEMHVYIDAPFPLSDKMPACYEKGIHDIVKAVIK
jgi:neutral ceramidase